MKKDAALLLSVFSTLSFRSPNLIAAWGSDDRTLLDFWQAVNKNGFGSFAPLAQSEEFAACAFTFWLGRRGHSSAVKIAELLPHRQCVEVARPVDVVSQRAANWAPQRFIARVGNDVAENVWFERSNRPGVKTERFGIAFGE